MTKWTKAYRRAYMKKWQKAHPGYNKDSGAKYYAMGKDKKPKGAPKKLTAGVINWNNPLARRLAEKRHKDTAWLSKDIWTRSQFQYSSVGQIIRAFKRGVRLAGTTK